MSLKPATNPEDHKTIFIESIGADIDEQVVDLVMGFNHKGIYTVSSCQGDPGIIGSGGRYGHVCFMMTNPSYEPMATFVFNFLYNLTKDMWDSVRVEMSASDEHFMGWVYFRNECIQELIDRLRKSEEDDCAETEKQEVVVYPKSAFGLIGSECYVSHRDYIDLRKSHEELAGLLDEHTKAFVIDIRNLHGRSLAALANAAKLGRK